MITTAIIVGLPTHNHRLRTGKPIERSPDFSSFSRIKSHRPSDFSSWDNLVFSIDSDRLKHFTIMAETTLERIADNLSKLNYEIEYLYLPNLG